MSIDLNLLIKRLRYFAQEFIFISMTKLYVGCENCVVSPTLCVKGYDWLQGEEMEALIRCRSNNNFTSL